MILQTKHGIKTTILGVHGWPYLRMREEVNVGAQLLFELVRQPRTISINKKSQYNFARSGRQDLGFRSIWPKAVLPKDTLYFVNNRDALGARELLGWRGESDVIRVTCVSEPVSLGYL